ncbi:hypothetical protein AVO42_01480 [Thiomicrospira sp. XS5]|uniref:hypothetical protein n=1 Tax=unclassified Thiomicrospira TaxID=2643099 RepID=UPI0004A72C49|nr:MULTISPECIES: hypothetical protein [unclassified Thiomicrospira]AZR80950.1 hypothetical protein AYJ59_00760 [Thiomicrospira sp. S5]KUJ74115.1 hypothetical protein AVO42_01480 [Thiomicrospira sp. XS5]
MLTTLIYGMLLTALVLAALWLGFRFLRRFPAFDGFNTRTANKRMLQLTLILYFSGVVLTVYWMMDAN